MRVTNQMMSNTSKININSNKVLLDKLNTQGTTYQKISRPSDDPVIAIRSLRLRTTLNELNQYYEKNVPDVRSWLELTESSLLSTRSAITDMYTNFVSGTSDTMTAEDRQKILDNLKALRDQVYANGDADSGGRNIFTGYRTATSLMFKEDTDLKYQIEETFQASDLERTTYISGQRDVSDFLGGLAIDQTKINQNDVYRIRLAYDNLDSAPMNSAGPTLTINPGPTTINTIVKTFSDNEKRDTAYSPPDGVAYFLPQTGEFVFGSTLKDTISELKETDTISVTYEKSKFEKGDLRPEHYFNCTSFPTTPANAAPIVYDDFNQKMEVDVSFNQKLEININANQAFTHDIGRDLDEMINAIEAAVAVDEKITKLEKMLEDPQYDAAAKEKIQIFLDAATKEQELYKAKLKDMFGAGVTKSQGYLDQLNLAIAEVGGKDARLELVENRLQEQRTSIDDLASKNDNVEITDVAIDLAAAELAYQASLMATGKISNTSLLSYL